MHWTGSSRPRVRRTASCCKRPCNPRRKEGGTARFQGGCKQCRLGARPAAGGPPARGRTTAGIRRRSERGRRVQEGGRGPGRRAQAGCRTTTAVSSSVPSLKSTLQRRKLHTRVSKEISVMSPCSKKSESTNQKDREETQRACARTFRQFVEHLARAYHPKARARKLPRERSAKSKGDPREGTLQETDHGC